LDSKYIFRKKINIFFADLLDAAGPSFFRVKQNKAQPKTYPPTHILVVRLDHLGDILLSTAVPKILKENFPDCRVTFLTSGAAAALLENNPFVDEALVYQAPWFSRKGAPKNARSIGFFKLAALLKQKKIQMALSLRGDLRENFLLWLADIPERIGYGITGGGFFMTREISYRRGMHESRHTLDLLKTIGVRRERLLPQIYFSKEEELISKNCETWGHDANDKLIGVQLEAGTSAKEWPLSHMKTFVDLCAKELSEYKIVFVGTDAGRFSWISENPSIERQRVNLIGKTSLRELLSLMKHFQVFISPDSGPAHIAACLGVPTLFLYSGTNVFEEWKPLAESAFVLRHETPCAPCGLRRCNVSGHPCMAGIEPEKVLRFIKEKML